MSSQSHSACSEPDVAVREAEPEPAPAAVALTGIELENAYDGIVARFAGKGMADAEAAWAEQRPTLLLFSASW